MNEEFSKPLYLPPFVPDNNDSFSGIGTKEYSILGIGMLGTIVTIIFGFIITGNMIFSILVPFSLFAGLFIAIRRDQYEESLVDKLILMWKYSHAQKRYEYVYFDELEDELEAERKGNEGEL